MSPRSRNLFYNESSIRIMHLFNLIMSKVFDNTCVSIFIVKEFQIKANFVINFVLKLDLHVMVIFFHWSMSKL